MFTRTIAIWTRNYLPLHIRMGPAACSRSSGREGLAATLPTGPPIYRAGSEGILCGRSTSWTPTSNGNSSFNIGDKLQPAETSNAPVLGISRELLVRSSPATSSRAQRRLLSSQDAREVCRRRAALAFQLRWWRRQSKELCAITDDIECGLVQLMVQCFIE